MKNVYLGTAVLMLGGLCWGACSEDEKIVEVEKIVIEKDYTKLSDAEREGLKGSPKSITEFWTNNFTENMGTIAPGAWKEKDVYEFNEAGYVTKMMGSTMLNTKVEQDGEPDPYDGIYYKQTTPDWRVVDSMVITRGTDNRPTGILEMSTSYRLHVTGSGNTMMLEATDSSPFAGSWYGFESIDVVKLAVSSAEKTVTTFDAANQKATAIIQIQEGAGAQWKDSKKIVYDLDAFGMPNEESNVEYDVPRDRSTSALLKVNTRAFNTEPSAKYVEVLDQKGNWITRYNTSNNSYIKREIVYY